MKAVCSVCSAHPEKQACLEPMTLDMLNAVMAIETQAYSHSWQRRQFEDCLNYGHHACVLRSGEVLLGYFVAMKGYEEVHLLTLAVAPDHVRRGYARLMLNALAAWSQQQSAKSLWLEVRASNTRAMRVYQAAGFQKIALRRSYYPTHDGIGEDAQVMCLALSGEARRAKQ